MIELKNVHKKYDKFTAVDNVNLTVQKGSIYGLLGSNGAGKTTLLKILAGIYREDEGEVTINGQAVYENTRLKEKIFFIPDLPYFFSQYTTKQMAEFYKSVYPDWSDERFTNLANTFELDVNQKIHTFSKGIQRQAAFWLALSAMPDILILDEPMDGLDPVIRKKVKSLLIQDVAERETTILVSSHNLREIEDICDHIGIMHKGKLLIEKELDDLKSDTHKIQLAFKNDPPAALFENFRLLYKEKRGSVLLYIVGGKEADITKHVQKAEPLIFDLLPLTLEEIFIYEMGDVGYAFKNILA